MGVELQLHHMYCLMDYCLTDEVCIPIQMLALIDIYVVLNKLHRYSPDHDKNNYNSRTKNFLPCRLDRRGTLCLLDRI